MTPAAQDPGFQTRMQELEKLLQEVETLSDPAMRARTAQIVQTLLEFHGAGVSRILECVDQAGDAGQQIIDKLGNDDLVSSLLLLHGLHPLSIEARVMSALDKARPLLHGGRAELLSLSDGAAHVRLKSSGHTCPSSAAGIKTAIEQAIYDKAPEVTSIQIESASETGSNGSAGFVPLAKVTAHNGKRLSLAGA